MDNDRFKTGDIKCLIWEAEVWIIFSLSTHWRLTSGNGNIRCMSLFISILRRNRKHLLTDLILICLTFNNSAWFLNNWFNFLSQRKLNWLLKYTGPGHHYYIHPDPSQCDISVFSDFEHRKVIWQQPRLQIMCSSGKVPPEYLLEKFRCSDLW